MREVESLRENIDDELIAKYIKSLSFTGRDSTAVFTKVDNLFRDRLRSSVTSFQDYTTAIVSIEELRKLVDLVREKFCDLWKILCAMREIHPDRKRGNDLVEAKQMQVSPRCELPYTPKKLNKSSLK